jgi:hypothetical protein
MATPDLTEWTATLDRIDADISRSLAALDRHEAEWGASSQTATPAISPEQLFVWLERRLGAWDAKLNEAVQLASSVEAQLAEREAALVRWRNIFVRWMELIEKGEARIAAPAGSPVAE